MALGGRAININGTKIPKVHKTEIAKRLYFLNHCINELKQQINDCEDETAAVPLLAEMKELYILKNRVLIKMIAEGCARIRCFQAGHGRSYCVVRINKDFSFHIPVTKYVEKVLNENSVEGIELRPKG